MIAIYETATGALVKVVLPGSEAREDLTGRATRTLPDDWSEDRYRWDPTGKNVVADMSRAKAKLLASIDAAAGVARQKWLTMAPGQADAYREKMVDVASLNGLGGTTALIATALGLIPEAEQKARWPFLWAEKEARKMTSLIAARDAITAAAGESRMARAEIERIRRTAKIAVKEAATMAVAQAAAGVTFPN